MYVFKKERLTSLARSLTFVVKCDPLFDFLNIVFHVNVKDKSVSVYHLSNINICSIL